MSSAHVWEDEKDKPNIEITGQDCCKNVLYGRRIDDHKTKVVKVGVAVPTPKDYIRIQQGNEVYEQEAHSPTRNYFGRILQLLGGIIDSDSASISIRKQDGSIPAGSAWIRMFCTTIGTLYVLNKGYYSPVDIDASGMVLGTDDTAWTFDDVKPGSLILQGTAAGKLVYHQTAIPIVTYSAAGVPSWTVKSRRFFDNLNANANTITIKEVCQLSSIWNYNAFSFNALEERTVLNTPYNILYKEGVVVTYVRKLEIPSYATIGLTGNGIGILMSLSCGIDQVGAGVYGAGHLSMKSSIGNIYDGNWGATWAFNRGGGVYPYGDPLAIAGVTTSGSLAGQGNTACAASDFILENLFTHGVGANQLIYPAQGTASAAYNAGTKTLTVTQVRVVTNSNAGNQIVKEVGIMGEFYAVNTTLLRQFLVSRTVLGSPITLANGESLAIVHDFSMTHN